MASVNPCPNGNDSTSILLQPLVGLTIYELWIQLIFFYGFLCGLLSTSGSILIWVGILRNKTLRNRFFVIVGCLTFCRTGIAIQFLLVAIYRSLGTLDVVSACQLRVVCHAIHFWLISGWTIEMSLLFLLVVDRIIGVTRPNFYRHLTTKSALQACIGIYVGVSLLKLVPSYVSANMMEVIPCVNLNSAPGVEFNAFSQDIDFIMVGVILILYFSLLLYVRRKVNSMKKLVLANGDTEASNLTLQRQLKLMPVLRNLVLMHCALALTAKLFLTMGAVWPTEQVMRIAAYGGMMSCIDLCANVFVLLVSNEDIRQAAVPWLAKSKVKVGGNCPMPQP